MKKQISLQILALTLAASISACSGETKPADINPTPHDSVVEGPGILSGKGSLFAGLKGKMSGESSSSIGVNAYLWKSSLEALSFMPIVQADSAGGVIITDWYANPNKLDERLKVNVYILGKQMSAQTLKVTVFKQVRKDEMWVDDSVSSQLARDLEDSILTNARVSKIKAQAAN